MEINIEKNYKDVRLELKKTNVKGMTEFLAWLDTTDFSTAPASTKFHLNVLGGLAQHSLNTLRFARNLNKEISVGCEDSSLVIAALLHDLCKANYYIEGEEWDKEHKEKTNQWRKKFVWKIEDQFPLGHGEKSVILATRFLDLMPEEALAIRWHMVKWDVSDAGRRTMDEARDKHPLVKIIAIADQIADTFETLPHNIPLPYGHNTLQI